MEIESREELPWKDIYFMYLQNKLSGLNKMAELGIRKRIRGEKAGLIGV